MAKIIFFEKTGCVNNTKQKKILTLAGHTVEPIDLLQHSWTEEELLSFFGTLEVKDWFNPNAPAIRDGLLFPDQLGKEEALKALSKNPILIKRPLLIIEGQKLVGFDEGYIEKIISLNKDSKPEISSLLKQNLVDCPQKNKGKICS